MEVSGTSVLRITDFFNNQWRMYTVTLDSMKKLACVELIVSPENEPSLMRSSPEGRDTTTLFTLGSCKLTLMCVEGEAPDMIKLLGPQFCWNEITCVCSSPETNEGLKYVGLPSPVIVVVGSTAVAGTYTVASQK